MIKKYPLFYPIVIVFLLSLGFILLLPRARAQTPPNPPSGLMLFDRSHVSFQVKWNPADPRGGAPITGYDVRYRDTADFLVWPHTAHTTDTRFEIADLKLNTSYEVQVRAVSADGNSDWSASGFTRTRGNAPPLTLPSDLVASGITGTSFRVSWMPPYTVDDAVLTGYEVKYRVYAVFQGALEEIIDAGHTGTAPFMVITGLFAETIYDVQVIALTSDGNLHYSPHLFVTTAGYRPDPPTNITAARTTTSIQLNWNAPQVPEDIPITGYDVRYRATEVQWVNGNPLISSFVEVSTTGPETTIELKNLSIGTSYGIGVRTVVANSKSIWSPVLYVATRPTFRMDPPSVSERTTNSLRVNWTVPNFPDDNTLIGYKVRYRPSVRGQNAPSPYTQVNIGGTETTLKITDLTPSTGYEIGVQALGANGNSFWSNPVYATTYSAFPIDPPTDITTSERTATSFRVSWSVPEAAAGIAVTGYRVRYRPAVHGQNAPSPYTQVNIGGTETTLKITDLTPSTSYEIGVRALSANASSLWSVPVYAATYSTVPIDIPIGLRSYEITPTGFRLSWEASNPPANATITGYEVRYRPVIVGTSQPYVTAKTANAETTLKITGLTPLKIYEIGVRALSAVGDSLWSQPYWTATASPPSTTTITKTHIEMDSVIFNELRNATLDTQDWVELRNISNVDVTFDGWALLIASNASSRTLRFPGDLTLPAGEVLLLLNTDPTSPGMPLATPENDSHRYLIMDQEFVLPQTDWTLVLQSRNVWEDVAGNYFFQEVKPSTAPTFTLDKAWYRAKPDKRGYQADAWAESGYHGGLGYDDDADPATSLGTPGYLQDALTSVASNGDLNGDGLINMQDMTLVSENMGQTGENAADLNGDGIVNVQDLILLASLIRNANN